jgi:carbon-monoxide dehydrogenase medium subunit
LLEPPWVVDINRIPGLDHIQQDGTHLRIGALARHAQVMAHPLVAQHLPLLAQAMPHIAHAAIRERGTLGGSLCLADPAAELPACMLALDARLHLRSQQGAREVAAADFFQGLYQTALAPGELLTEVLIPLPEAGSQMVFDEFSRRHGDYAMAGLAAWSHPASQRSRLVRQGVRLGHAFTRDKPKRLTGIKNFLSNPATATRES